jgi:hypothetical protein
LFLFKLYRVLRDVQKPPTELTLLKADEVKAKKARRSEVEVAEDEIATGNIGDYCSVFNEKMLWI